MDVRLALTTAPPPLDQVLPGLLAGTVGAFVGPGGVGKTMVLTQIACALATGLPPLGGALGVAGSKPSKVVLFLAEESCLIMHHRLHPIVAQLAKSSNVEDKMGLLDLLRQNLKLLPLAGHSGLVTLQAGADNFDDVIDVCQGARLVVFDPLRRFHHGDENQSKDMTAVVSQAEKVAFTTTGAVLLSHHTSRNSILNGTADQVTASRGSTALPDNVRWQVNLSPVTPQQAAKFGLERKDLVRLDSSKANYCSPFDSVALRRLPDSGILVPTVGTSQSKRVLRKGTEEKAAK
ncbi:helicase RepA family protein [Cupriavidus sp. TMH.W2]|uniref:helicase RepA family protein n=1 Tax=Cupriavidus sp. TMH.W2 TaxID=3434465 RepID=UPI003D78659B